MYKVFAEALEIMERKEQMQKLFHDNYSNFMTLTRAYSAASFSPIFFKTKKGEGLFFVVVVMAFFLV